MDQDIKDINHMKVIRITTQKVKGENLIWFHNTVHLVSLNRRP